MRDPFPGRHARRSLSDIHLPVTPSLPARQQAHIVRIEAAQGTPDANSERHWHPDPFDFAQDKGHRRISPSYDLFNPGADPTSLRLSPLPKKSRLLRAGFFLEHGR